MFTMTRPTVTVQAPVQIDRRLYEDARAFNQRSMVGRMLLRQFSPRRYEAGLRASRLVGDYAYQPQVMAGTQAEPRRMGYLERKVRESRGY